MHRPIAVFMYLFPLLLLAQGRLEVVVHIPEQAPSGTLHLALCPNEDAFRIVEGCRIREVVTKGDAASFSFPDLPAGTYAVKVFLDMNGNGVLDKNELGIPQEPVGFSNDAMGRMGPASFKEASFAFSGVDTAVAFTLRVPPRMEER